MSVATDGTCILWVRHADVGLSVEPLPDRVAACQEIYEAFYGNGSDMEGCESLGSLTRDWLYLYPVTENVPVRIGRVTISWEQWQRVTMVMQFLGLEGFNVYQSMNAEIPALMFRYGSIECDGESYCLYVMGLNQCDVHQPLTLSDECMAFDNPDDLKNVQYGMNEHEASLFIENYDKVMAERAAGLRNKRLGNLWRIRVTQTGYFYVEAADAEDAERIAQDVIGEVDADDAFYDSDVEFDGVDDDDVDVDDLTDDDQVYTVDEGWMDGEDYADMCDEADDEDDD